jgi:mercuric ion transport protein
MGGERTAPALTLAGIAALLASTCCVVPLVLALVGVSGAWVSQLHWMAPYSEAFTILAVGALLLAAWRIYRPVPQGAVCEEGTSCARASAATRGWFWVLAGLTLVPLVVRLAAPLFY